MQFKKSALISLVMAIFFACQPTDNKTFNYSPEKPTQSNEITVQYNPVATPLKDSKAIDMVIYKIGESLNKTSSVELQKENNLWTGKIKPTEKDQVFLIKFTNGNVTDNNNKKGYEIYLFKDGKKYPNAETVLNVTKLKYKRILNVEPNEEKTYKLLSASDALRQKHFYTYIKLLSKFDENKKDSIISFIVTSIEKKDSLTKNDYSILSKFHPTQKEKYKAEMNKKFKPDERFTELNKLFSIKDPIKTIKAVKIFAKKYPNDKLTSMIFDSAIGKLVDTKKYKKAIKLLEKNESIAGSGSYNSIAWSLYENKQMLDKALDLASKGIEKENESMQQKLKKIPPFYTKKEFEKILKRSAANIYDTKGAILVELKKFKKAEDILEKATRYNNFNDASINERYITSLIKNKKNKLAKKVIEKVILAGKYNDNIISMLKGIFDGTEKQCEKYISDLVNKSNEKQIEEIKKEMINKPAPDFKLKAADGKEVKLSDFKGKVVIIDFWATWCGPCKASFPGMQKLVDYYSNNNNVVFLFVNTWERVDNKIKNAKDFITKNNYKFPYLLIDAENKAVTSYKVEGIPTKFIVDPKGNIRFKDVGFPGEVEMIQKMKIMIDYLAK